MDAEARDLLLASTDREAVIDAALSLIQAEGITGYHGSRLTDAEVHLIRSSGLLPLRVADRRRRLTRALSPHPRWPEVAQRLDGVIQAYGPGGRAGRREDQVHLALSRAGLTKGFNHYLTHGAECDQHMAYELLGQEGTQLLSRDGTPRVIRIAVPGSSALDAAHPHFSPSDLRTRGDIPSLVREFITAWSNRLICPDFQSETMRIGCGMVFRSVVPASWIIGIETLAG